MTEYGHITPGPLKNPGVGNYNLNRDLNKTSYTLRSRTPELRKLLKILYIFAYYFKQIIDIPVFLNGKRTY